MKGKKKAEGKVVVITGASSGAGRAMAVEFARQGASLVLAARRKEALEEVVRECAELGATAVAVYVDTRESESLHQLAMETAIAHGRIDIWINNAGVLAVGELEKIPSDVNEAVVRTNLLGYIHGAHAVLPIFKQQGYGLLINNISVGGWFPTPYMTAYSASKFGLQGFSDSLKGELKDYPRIHVCDLCPAFLDSPGMQHAANFTGKELTPSPPLYDPRQVAKAAVSFIDWPRPKATVGAFPVLLRMAYRLFPGITRTITASLIANYLEHADETSNTSGNVLHPVPYGTGIDGGWRSTSMKPSGGRGLLVLAGIAAGILLLRKR